MVSGHLIVGNPSLSARRAWIEMQSAAVECCTRSVALRKESVDRNVEDYLNAGSLERSLSARRAWIEISSRPQTLPARYSRSPQGERG